MHPLRVAEAVRLGQVGPTGEKHRFVKRWHFRYEILNANAFRLTGIYYSPFNPRHPIFGRMPDFHSPLPCARPYPEPAYD